MAALNDVTTAVIDLLRDEGLFVGGVEAPIGDNEEPAGAGWQGAPKISQFVPYVIVWDTAGGWSRGTLADPNEDKAFVVEPLAVSVRKADVRILRSRIEDVLLDPSILHRLFFPGRRLLGIPRLDVRNAPSRKDTADPPLWEGSDRYRIPTTPA